MSKYLRINNETVYENTDQDKDMVYTHLTRKIEFAKTKNTSPIGTKNLVYFSVCGNDDYISLLELCLNTIQKSTPSINFDLLFITQENFIDRIKALPILSNFNYYFHTVSVPNDGVAASLKKTKIFNYENINNYKKILYIDCDIACIKPLNQIFDQDFDTSKLQVASNPIVTVGDWQTDVVFFGLKYLSAAQSAYIDANQPIPFNAGQFLFYNTEQMRENFKNLNWLMDVWPGEYFFEQSFMNFYFCLHDFCSKDVLHPKTTLMLISPLINISYADPKFRNRLYHVGGKTTLRVEKRTANPYTLSSYENYDLTGIYLIHFIGMTLYGEDKLDFATRFLEIKNICQ